MKVVPISSQICVKERTTVKSRMKGIKRKYDDCCSTQHLTIQKEIGAGTYCVVYEAVDKDGASIACKMLQRDVRRHDCRKRDESNKRRLFDEFKLQRTAGFASDFVTKPIRKAIYHTKPCLLLEYVKGKTLYEQMTTVLNQKSERLSCYEVWKIIHYVVTELRKINTYGVYHNDTHLRNVMVGKREGDSRKLKLLDFNLANHLGKAIFKRGRNFLHLDETIFLNSLRLIVPKIYAKGVGKWVGEYISPYMTKLRQALKAVPMKHWAKGTPITYTNSDGTKTRAKFKHVDLMGCVHLSTESGEMNSGILPENCQLDWQHQHILYSFAHIRDLPVFALPTHQLVAFSSKTFDSDEERCCYCGIKSILLREWRDGKMRSHTKPYRAPQSIVVRVDKMHCIGGAFSEEEYETEWRCGVQPGKTFKILSHGKRSSSQDFIRNIEMEAKRVFSELLKSKRGHILLVEIDYFRKYKTWTLRRDLVEE